MPVFTSQRVCVQFINMNNKKCIHKIKNNCDVSTTFIILCSQKSNKRGYKNIPLTVLDNKNFLIDEQIQTIRSSYPDSEIIIISGFEHDKLVSHIHSKKYKNIRIAENKYHKMSSALVCWIFGLNLALPQNTYIIHGDRLFNKSCISPSNNKQTHTIIHNEDKNNYDIGLLIDGGKLLNMSYGLPNVWSEILFINESDFDIARNLINDHVKRKFYNLESFINTLLNQITISVIKKKQDDIKTLKEL